MAKNGGSPIYQPPGSGGGGGGTPASTVQNSGVGDVASVGGSTNYAREDHVHGREAFAAPSSLNTDGSSSVGTAATVAHSDHKHAIPSTLDTNARIAVKKAGSLIGTRRGLNFISTVGHDWTVADNVGSEHVSITPSLALTDLQSTRTKSLQIIGHSWTAGAAMSSFSAYAQHGFTAQLCGMLGVHNDNLYNYGISGSALSMPVNAGFTPTPLNGWAGCYQFITPTNSSLFVNSTNPVRVDSMFGSPAPTIILHGINDVGGTSFWQRLNTQNAYSHALRAVISRCRAGALFCSTMSGGAMVWDSSITASGSWTNVQQSLTNTGAGVKNSSTNGDTVTFTIPKGYTGGTIAISFIGQFNAYDTLASTAAAGATTITLSKSTTDWASSLVEFPCTVLVGSESVVATAYNSTTGVMTLASPLVNTWIAGYQVMVDTSRLAVTWSSNRPSDTIVSGTAKLRLAGQGQSGCPVSVVQRFIGLDQSYAGYTITATVADCNAGDTSKVKFDSVWIEALYPAPVIVANIPKLSYGYGYAAYRDYWYEWNNNVTARIAEFDNRVALLDLDTILRDRDAILTTGIATGTAGSTVSLSVTANTTAFETTPGYLIGVENEIMSVDSITGSYPNYTLTCTRSPAGYTSYSTIAAHTTGCPISRQDNLQLDHIHETPRAASIMARECVRLLDAMPAVPAAYQGLMTSSWTQEALSGSIGIGDTDWLQPAMGGTTTVIPTQNQPYAVPIFIPKESVIVGAGVVCGAASTGSVRLGLWAPDNYHSLPNQLIADMGVISPVTTNTFYQTGAVYTRVRPGWYWVGCMRTTTASVTLRAVGGANNAPGYQLPLNGNPSGSTSIYTGYSGPTVSVSGQFDAFFYTFATAAPTLTAATPVVWLYVRTTGY